MPTTIFNNLMDSIHDHSLTSIELLQASFPNNKQFMINISTFFDPRYVFLIYAPILFAINKRVGHRMIIALTLTEWSNQILKWLLAGERPYWYVLERSSGLGAANSLPAAGGALLNRLTGIDSYDMASSNLVAQIAQPVVAQLKQFPVTCEMGAGSPSGHAMVTATVWYILIDAYLKGELQLLGLSGQTGRVRSSLTSAKDSFDNLFAKISWSAYAVILVLVSVSRVYLACHFPHQCICGAILGASLAQLVINRLPVEHLRRKHFVLTTGLMFATALGTYALLRGLGVNPLWSVDKATRWCVKKEYLHMDTTPFFSMVRYLGFCMGAGLAYEAPRRQSLRGQQQEGNLLTCLLSALGSILFGQFLLALPIPKTHIILFYLISFVTYTLFSYSMAAPIPKLAAHLVAQTTQRRTKV